MRYFLVIVRGLFLQGMPTEVVARHRWLLALIAGSTVAAVGCGITADWRAPDAPTPVDVKAVLTERSTETLSHRLQPTGIPDIPVREHLRPCCAFGYALRVRAGFLPVLGYRIGNLKTVDELGQHRYDSGLLMIGSDGNDQLVGDEHNGLVFTCHGGFIDTAHVRDYADWTIFLAAHLYEHLESGTTIDLPSEGGQRRIRLEPMEADFLRDHDSVSITIAIAQWLAFRLSVWHEIATWYGWSWTPLFPEKDSAFSPEDLYSNVLGMKIAAATALERSARSAALYDRSVDAWLRQSLRFLGPTSKRTAVQAMQSLDGVWWDSTVEIPDPRVVLRRNFSIGETIAPWLVPEALAPDTLRARVQRECGGWPKPLPLPNPDDFSGTPLRRLARLEIHLDDDLARKPPLSALGRVVNQDAFPEIIAAIRAENRREFGPQSDQPDLPATSVQDDRELPRLPPPGTNTRPESSTVGGEDGR